MAEKPKRFSYLRENISISKEDFRLVEIITESMAGIMTAYLATVKGYAGRSEMGELFFLAVGCAIAAPICGFLVRLVFITPAKMYRKIEERMREQIAVKDSQISELTAQIESLNQKLDDKIEANKVREKKELVKELFSNHLTNLRSRKGALANIGPYCYDAQTQKAEEVKSEELTNTIAKALKQFIGNFEGETFSAAKPAPLPPPSAYDNDTEKTRAYVRHQAWLEAKYKHLSEIISKIA